MSWLMSMVGRRAQLGRSLVRFLGTSGESRNMISEDLVVVEHHPGITKIGINRPHVRNCVDTHTAVALLKAFQDFDSDPEAKVAILYGVGGNFCAGYDLTELSTNPPTSLTEYGRGPMGPTRYETSKPVIAAVEGFAVAGGLELALWCDLRVVEENAVMGVYCRRFGVPLIDGGTVRLPAIVGLGRALDLILTGRAIKAKEALEWGLATNVAQCGTALGIAFNLATSLLKFPQECMLADRRSALRSVFSPTSLQDALKYEHENGIPIIGQESVAGAQRFSKDKVGRHGKFYNITPNNDPTKSKL